jgi:hypothetical protein
MYTSLVEDNEALRARVAELEGYNDEHQSLHGLMQMSIEKLEAERDRLREALDEVCSNANPRFTSMREQLVRDGIAMSGAIKHYEIAPHYIHRARAALGVE